MNALLVLALALTSGAVDRSSPPPVKNATPYRADPPLKTLMRDAPTFYFLKRNGPPLVDVVVRIGAGARDDPRDKPGLAALTATMLDEGAGKRGALEIADALDHLGASLSISAGWDSTTMHLHVPQARFRAAMKIVNDVLRKPTFAPADWSRIKKRQTGAFLAERDSPWRLAGRARQKALFEGTRYALPLAGTAASIDKITVGDMKAFHARFYRVDNVELTIAGNLKLERLNDDLRAAFVRWWIKRDALVRAPLASRAPPARAARILLVDKPGAAQSVLYASAQTLNPVRPLDPAVEVMNTLLGGSFTSRLNQNLREKNQYSYGARSSFVLNDEVQTFSAWSAVEAKVTAPALKELYGELKRIRTYVVDDEAARAANYTGLTFPGEFETGRAAAQYWSWATRRSVPAVEVLAHPGRVLAIDQRAALLAARRTIDLEHLQIVVVGDRKSIEAPLRALKIAPVEIVDVDGLF